MSRIVIKNVRLSYANIWEPKRMQNDKDGKMRYSASLLISKDDTKTIKAINKAIEEAKVEGKAKLANKNGVVPKNLKLPLRDGDEDRPDDDAYAGCYFLNANASADHPLRSSTAVLSQLWIARRCTLGAMPTSASHSLRSTRRAMSVSDAGSATSRRCATAIT